MTWLAIVQLLLSIVNSVMNRLGDAKQQQIGEDTYVRKLLAELIVRLQVAKQIDIDSADWTDDDVDRILQRYYRAEGSTGDQQ